MTLRTKSRTALLMALVLGGGILMCVTAGGCYERVVGARGLGAGAYDVNQPYQENSHLDDWIFGPKPTNDRIVRTKTPQD
jgi:hypothetical protein